VFVKECANYVIRRAVKDDEPFLWEMLYYAAHMDEDGEVSFQAAKTNPDLVKYARDWGCETDVGCIAFEPGCNEPIGAAWLRLLIGDEKTTSYVNDDIPELAIAVLPEYLGRGVGTQLLQHVLEAATNPAIRLYERIGFVIVGKTVNRVGSESLNMQIHLS
jgi:GNAT superfamily N-acetyltransferase